VIEQTTYRFVYDEWNVVLVLLGDGSTRYKFTWGLDLSGLGGDASVSGIHGSGGIGGLLANQTVSTPTTDWWYLYDGNGNVTQVIRPTDLPYFALSTWAHFEYDPYGNVAAFSGFMGVSIRRLFCFSTKWVDTELAGAEVYGAVGTDGLYYYGYRYYSPRLGRWMSRDPIEEQGGLNLYGFVGNEPVHKVDTLGLLSWRINEKECTITLQAKIQFEFTGSWTTNRRTTFSNLFETRVESAFNARVLRIYPNPNGRHSVVIVSGYIGFTRPISCNCPCRTSGWRPRLDVYYGWFAEDFLIFVAANPTRVFMPSQANLGGPRAWLDEADVYMRPDIPQVPAAHEFGHLLGLNHPGQALTPPAVPNTPADYAADPNSLMGAGMDMRASYYDRWVQRLDAAYRGCRPHRCR